MELDAGFSKSLAYIPSGIAGTGKDREKGPIVVVPAAGGAARTLKAGGRRRASIPGEGEYAPVMDEKGRELFRRGGRRALAGRRRRRGQGAVDREDPGLEDRRARSAVRACRRCWRPAGRPHGSWRASRRPRRSKGSSPRMARRRKVRLLRDRHSNRAASRPLLQESQEPLRDLQPRRATRRPARSCSRPPTSSTSTTCGSSTRRPARRARSRTSTRTWRSTSSARRASSSGAA